jgi:hypothetical protein
MQEMQHASPTSVYTTHARDNIILSSLTDKSIVHKSLVIFLNCSIYSSRDQYLKFLVLRRVHTI